MSSFIRNEADMPLEQYIEKKGNRTQCQIGTQGKYRKDANKDNGLYANK